MNAKSKKALKDSIAHWRRMATGKERKNEAPSAQCCALCAAYPDCEGCPVATLTGDGDCEGTPYFVAYVAWKEWQRTGAGEAAFREAATVQLNFLRALLPERER